MVHRFLLMLLVISAAWMLSWVPASASYGFLQVTSPDHAQTFSYGSERHRAWVQMGADKHLSISMQFTNDPFVSSTEPRQWDDFVFSFPNVRLGRDGRTFYYHDGDGHVVPVAERRPDFLGIDEIHLLPNASLDVSKIHGYLTLTIVLGDA